MTPSPSTLAFFLPEPESEVSHMNETVASDETKKVVIVPLAAETLTVDTEEQITGGVRFSKTIVERDETVDPALMRQDVEVVRVPIGQFVETAPAPRQEGDTYIVPVVEEVLVVVKRLRVVEEIHLTRRQSEYHAPQTVTLRSEEAHIERWASAENATGDTLP